MADERSLWEMNQNLMAGVGQYQALDEVYCSSISEPVEATAEQYTRKVAYRRVELADERSVDSVFSKFSKDLQQTHTGAGPRYWF